jgi:hypothetical protein
MGTCTVCGRPLERADDFWYCDNPDCSGRSAPSPPSGDGPAGGVSSKPVADRAGEPTDSRAGR